jgi:hypothetical protein
MIKNFFKFSFISVITLTFLMSTSFAQKEEASLMDESVGDFYVVGGIGLGGMILGLSTLSFESEPKEHYDRIYTGTAIGIIIGVFVVAGNQADRSRVFFEEGNEEQAFLRKKENKFKDFSTAMRTTWHNSKRPTTQNPLLNVQHSWRF